MIAEKDIDSVFSSVAIAGLAKCIRVAPDFDFDRFTVNIRSAARTYFAERARTDWKRIKSDTQKLYRLAEGASGKSEAAALRLADHLGSLDQSTRLWLERCVHRAISFPLPEEIRNAQTRQQAVIQLRSILSYGLERRPGRKRPGGKQSRSIKPWLRVPQIKGPGRPRDLAARELVQLQALAYLEATGKPSPRWVSRATEGPFLRLVDEYFRLIGLKTENVVDLINERAGPRKDGEARKYVIDDWEP